MTNKEKQSYQQTQEDLLFKELCTRKPKTYYEVLVFQWRIALLKLYLRLKHKPIELKGGLK